MGHDRRISFLTVKTGSVTRPDRAHWRFDKIKHRNLFPIYWKSDELYIKSYIQINCRGTDPGDVQSRLTKFLSPSTCCFSLSTKPGHHLFKSSRCQKPPCKPKPGNLSPYFIPFSPTLSLYFIEYTLVFSWPWVSCYTVQPSWVILEGQHTLDLLRREHGKIYEVFFNK